MFVLLVFNYTKIKQITLIIIINIIKIRLRIWIVISDMFIISFWNRKFLIKIISKVRGLFLGIIRFRKFYLNKDYEGFIKGIFWNVFIYFFKIRWNWITTFILIIRIKSLWSQFLSYKVIYSYLVVIYW